MAMQVMVTGDMSIEEQLAHMSEAVTKLTKMVEEKDAQIASLINNKWEGHQDKEPGQDAHKKGPHYEAASREKRLGHETESGEKPHGKGDAASVGSLSVQQLQDMIANTIRVQYGAPSRDTLMYSKPYTRRILLTSLNTNLTKRSFACTSQNCIRHKRSFACTSQNCTRHKRSFACTSQNCIRHQTLLRLHEPKLHKAQTLLRLHEPKLHKAPNAPSPARAKTA
ncbi:hypothetical protein L3X38_006835 [Prunus dulcis]|uniref:Uncharacterized protein n=1 Tax=Prunus dulcis TaxID=3755 RepID=A0AAD5F5C4_PRUDU|nr:hypothetical protein L3X38_006835 [Prunus dulcis]